MHRHFTTNVGAIIQTHERFKRTLFIRTKHNIGIVGVIPFIKLQNYSKQSRCNHVGYLLLSSECDFCAMYKINVRSSLTQNHTCSSLVVCTELYHLQLYSCVQHSGFLYKCFIQIGCSVTTTMCSALSA